MATRGAKARPASAPGEAEDAAFNKELRHDPRAAGSEGIAHRHLAGTGRGAQKQKRSDIDGAHGNKKTGHAHENDERSFEIGAAGRESARVVFNQEMRVVEEVFGEALSTFFVEGQLLRAECMP